MKYYIIGFSIEGIHTVYNITKYYYDKEVATFDALAGIDPKSKPDFITPLLLMARYNSHLRIELYSVKFDDEVHDTFIETIDRAREDHTVLEHVKLLIKRRGIQINY